MTKSNKVKIQDIFVSTVIVPRNDFAEIHEYCEKLTAELKSNYANYEIIVIDNGLAGKSVERIVHLLDTLPCIRLVRLARPYSHDIAVMAGLEASIGDYTVVTDPEIDAITNILAIVEANKQSDIVQGVADLSTRKTLSGSSMGRKLFYWYNRRYLATDIPVQATYLIALSRRAVRALTMSSRHDSYVRHMIKSMGYSYTEFPYKTKKDPRNSHSLWGGTMQALDIITSHSTHPLRLMSWIGFVASVLNIIYALYVVIVAATRTHVAEGWTTMSLQLSGMFFLLFLFMVVLSEYIGKILIESRREVRYNVLDELTSTVSVADTERKNIAK